MGRFAERYTTEQRDAILRACCDDGITATEAVKRAKAGELYGLKPFDFNQRTAADYAAKERVKRQAARDVENGRATGSDSVRRTADLALESIRNRVRTLSRKRVWSPTDAELHRKLLTNLREVDAIYRRIPVAKSGTRPPAQTEPDQPNGDRRSELVAELLSAMEQKASDGVAEDVADVPGGQAHTHTSAPSSTSNTNQ